MSTNIAAERGRALQTLYNDNPALSSCFIGGIPGVGIVAVNRCPAAEEGGEPEYAIWPQCVSVALVMTIIGLFRPTWDNASADRIGAHPYTRSASREASNGIRAAEVKLATAHSNTAWRRWRSRRAVSAFVCQMGARISSKSALVTSDTGIFPDAREGVPLEGQDPLAAVRSTSPAGLLLFHHTCSGFGEARLRLEPPRESRRASWSSSA